MVYHSFFVKHKCPKCGFEWDEDLNAPKNIPANIIETIHGKWEAKPEATMRKG